MNHRPTFNTYLRLGQECEKHFPPIRSLEEVGRLVGRLVGGRTRQNTWTDSMVALGKVVFRLRELLKKEKGE